MDTGIGTAALEPLSADARILAASRAFVEALFAGVRPVDFRISFWDGSSWGPDPGQTARSTILLRHRGALRRMFLPPGDLSLGEAYIHGHYDIEGDAEHAVSIAARLAETVREPGAVATLLATAARLPADARSEDTHDRRPPRLEGPAHTRRRDRRAVRYHYDVGNPFFALWLDREMVYSCGYFAEEGEDIDTCQLRELDRVCRKLDLRPGDRLLDLGCGWGGLVRRAAGAFGVQALGITLSDAQAAYANERIEAEGLSGMARVEVMDYRDAPALGTFDKAAAIGMAEHVGAARLAEYFGCAARCLLPGGLFVNQSVSSPEMRTRPSKRSFLNRYVFPDGELVPVGEMLLGAEEAGFEVRDLEALGRHYVLTLRRWVSRLEENEQAATDATDEATYRAWRLYMAAAADAFSRGTVNAYETVLRKPPEGRGGDAPLTRAGA